MRDFIKYYQIIENGKCLIPMGPVLTKPDMEYKKVKTLIHKFGKKTLQYYPFTISSDKADFMDLTKNPNEPIFGVKTNNAYYVFSDSIQASIVFNLCNADMGEFVSGENSVSKEEFIKLVFGATGTLLS